MNATYDFRGKVALVTGAAMGMGFAAARLFAEAAAAVVLSDRDEAALSKAAAGLEAAGHKVLGVTCDVANEAEVAAAVLFLCSDAASFILGVALPVDGG